MSLHKQTNAINKQTTNEIGQTYKQKQQTNKNVTEQARKSSQDTQVAGYALFKKVWAG